jgi:hypothetical protein
MSSAAANELRVSAVSPSTDNRPSFYITLSQERRAIALATGLRLGSQRIEHWIWFNRLLIQGKGIAAITSADAVHELGMSLDQWKAFSRWIRNEGWAQIEKAYGQGFIWSHGQRWHQINWPILNAQAEAEHLASREPLKRRATVKRAAISRNGSSGGKSTNGETALVVGNPPMEPSSSGGKSTNAIGVKSTNGIPETDTSTTDLSPLKPLTQTSLRAQTSFGSQTSGSSAEVEQQASALAGSSPAEVPEQPEQPDQQHTTTVLSVRDQAKAQRQQKQRQSQQQSQPEPTNNQNESDYVESQPKAEPLPAWAGLPVESLVDGDVLIDSDGSRGFIEITTSRNGDVEMTLNFEDGGWVNVYDAECLRGWSMATADQTTATVDE